MKNQGQITLIVLMIITVVLTIGIATASRVVTDVKLSTQIQESGQAFYAAEAGIELGLSINYDPLNPPASQPVDCSIAVSVFGNTAQTVCGVTFLGTDGNAFSLGNIALGEVRTLWMIDHNSSGDLPTDIPAATKYGGEFNITWVPAAADIEIIVVYLDNGNYLVNRIVASGGSVNIKASDYPGTDPLTDGWILARIKPLTQSLYVTVGPNSNAPNQGKMIESTGEAYSGTTGSGVTRKITYTKLYPSLPAIFDYVIFSNGDLLKL